MPTLPRDTERALVDAHIAALDLRAALGGLAILADLANPILRDAAPDHRERRAAGALEPLLDMASREAERLGEDLETILERQRE